MSLRVTTMVFTRMIKIKINFDFPLSLQSILISAQNFILCQLILTRNEKINFLLKFTMINKIKVR
jgi:hypothetical protein